MLQRQRRELDHAADPDNLDCFRIRLWKRLWVKARC